VKSLVIAGALLVLAVPAASAARLPIVASQDWWPVYSPNGDEVAFTRVSGRTMTLEVVNVGARRTFRIAANQGQLAPSWSSDGRLAFSLGGKIYTADAGGSARKQLTSEGHAYAPAWRPGSSDIAFLTTVGATNTDLWVNDTLWARNAIGKPAWSRDGAALAFQRDDGIYVTTGPGMERRIASIANPQAPAWSPDGKFVAYVAGQKLWIVPPDGSVAPKAIAPAPRGTSDPSWSRQSDAVAYTSRGSVLITYLDTGKTVRLIAAGGVGASFSPVADMVAFSGPRAACRDHMSIRIYEDNEFNGPVTGSCQITGTPGNDVIEGTGAGGDVILAGAGNDSIHTRNGHRDTVDCGPGRDTVYADKNDVLRGCEIVHRS
jgi:Tol biopolymer transport system component